MWNRFIVLVRAVLASALCIAASAATVDDSMAERTRACTGCHGAQGRAGPDGYYPRLAGKPEGYLYNQLLQLRDGRRHYAPMRTLLAPLSDAYLLEMARYFSQLEVPYAAPTRTAVDAALLRRGRQLALDGDPALELPACAQCHGKALTGTWPQVPGLLGLPRDYLNAQLGGWRTRQRQAHSPDCMAQIANRLQPQDVTAVTHWLAAQPVPAQGKPQAQPTPWPAGMQALRCGSAYPPAPTSEKAAAPVDPQVAQGAYLARIGNCASCHTAAQGAPYAGQRAIETPFGPVYSSNITSDVSTGIGAWSGDDFWQALHHGRSRDGRLLNPAFPYPSLSRMTRADTDALLAFLKTVPAVVQPQRPHGVRWPLGTQLGLAAWRTLFFAPAVHVDDAAQSPAWNRGAYLVQGVGHCGECHTARNALGAPAGPALAGAVVPVGNWVAPSLREGPPAGRADGHPSPMEQLLRTGVSRHGAARGPMAEVVQGGTQYLRDEDLQAMRIYLESLAAVPTVPAPAPQALAASALSAGGALYRQHCADCHGAQGEGQAQRYPALAGNRALQSPQPNNSIFTVLHGGFAPVTAANPRPYGMPPFVLTLNDAQTAQVLTFIRQSWGNRAAPVTEADVTLARNRWGR